MRKKKKKKIAYRYGIPGIAFLVPALYIWNQTLKKREPPSDDLQKNCIAALESCTSKRMSVVSCILLALVVACSFREGKLCGGHFRYILEFLISVGFGAAVFVDGPSSGSVIANFEGAINTTLICDVTIEGVGLIDTSWSVANFRGIPRRLLIDISDQNLFFTGGSLFNELTISSWTSEVDQVIVFCGSGLQPTQANVTLRLYRKYVL